jgi:adenylate cyclase 8
MEDHLELAYQRYSHRQRQKSLIIVNLVDSLLKIVLATVTAGFSHYLRSLLCSSV